jgi:hypothetical protein
MVRDVVPTDLVAQRGAGDGVIGGQRHKLRRSFVGVPAKWDKNLPCCVGLNASGLSENQRPFCLVRICFRMCATIHWVA